MYRGSRKSNCKYGFGWTKRGEKNSNCKIKGGGNISSKRLRWDRGNWIKVIVNIWEKIQSDLHEGIGKINDFRWDRAGRTDPLERGKLCTAIFFAYLLDRNVLPLELSRAKGKVSFIRRRSKIWFFVLWLESIKSRLRFNNCINYYLLCEEESRKGFTFVSFFVILFKKIHLINFPNIKL